jgi:hypothetical protein
LSPCARVLHGSCLLLSLLCHLVSSLHLYHCVSLTAASGVGVSRRGVPRAHRSAAAAGDDGRDGGGVGARGGGGCGGGAAADAVAGSGRARAACDTGEKLELVCKPFSCPAYSYDISFSSLWPFIIYNRLRLRRRGSVTSQRRMAARPPPTRL